MRLTKLFRAMTLMSGFSLGIMTMHLNVAQAESTAEERALAEALFRDGKALMNAGDAASACPKLAESQRLDPGGGTQLLLGLCLEAAGQLATAWVELNEALSMAQRDGNDVREALAREHIEALLPRLARIEFIFATPHPLEGLVIKQDGGEVPQAAWSTHLPLDPGVHVLVFEAPGYVAQELKLDILEEGLVVPVQVPILQPVSENLESIPVSTAAAEKTESSPTSTEQTLDEPAVSPGTSSRKALAYGLGSVGVAALVAGSVLGIRAISLNNQVEDACPEPSCNQLDLEDEYSASRSSATWSTVLFSVGLVGLATGTYLLMTDASRASQARATQRQAGVAATWGYDLGLARLEILDVTASRVGGTLSVGGSF